ncbi:MAG: hypothetical protein OES24_11330 [Acidimicrobiia bacterium]|nr:hypothetical protein [Acidimicrobiia bacterium]
MGLVMSYPPPSHRGSRSTPPPRPRPRPPTVGDSYRSSRLRTFTRSGGPQRSVLQVDAPDECGPRPEPRTAPEWLLLLRAALGRERTALTVAVIALVAVALVIVVIPVITGQMS